MKKYLSLITALLCLSVFLPPMFIVAAAPRGVIEVSGLTFRYPDADSVRIDLVCTGPVTVYTITKSLDRTVIDLPGVTSRLYAAYTVRNSFDVQVETEAVDVGRWAGLRLTVISPRWTVVERVRDGPATSFVVRRDMSAANKTPPLVSRKTVKPIASPANTPAPSVAAAKGPNIGSPPTSREAPPRLPITPKSSAVERRVDDPGAGSVRGGVRDERGAVIADAEVIFTGADRFTRTIRSDAEGNFKIRDLAPGRYTLRVQAKNFTEFIDENIQVERLPAPSLDVVLQVNVIVPEVVTVGEDTQALSSDLSGNAAGVVLRQQELDAMPNDPQGFTLALKALASATGGAGGNDVIVDGFAGGRVPPKTAIKEIRISKNTYSAEYSRPGNGRIEIITKPGMEDYSGGGYFGFNDSHLNSRDPFTAPPLPYGSKDYGFYFGGPVIKRRLSFFSNFDGGRSDLSTSVNARVLDGGLNIVPYDHSFISPQDYANGTTRFDLQLNDRNTFVTKYAYSGSTGHNGGFGGTTLSDRAFDSRGAEHLLQFLETTVLSSNIVTETRSQYVRRDNSRQARSPRLSIDVPGAFLSGSSFGRVARVTDRVDIHNVTTATQGSHTIRAGAGFRYSDLRDSTDEGFGGMYRFDGAIAPLLDTEGRVVLDSSGQAVLTQLTGLERYRRTLLLAGLGRTPAEIRSLGGGASQFSITRGKSGNEIVQHSFYGFAQDEWKLRPNFTLGVGLRVEGQSNVPHRVVVGPRISFAWSKQTSGKGGKSESPTLVVRGGTGLFYEPFGEDLTLRADRINGTDTRQYLVTDPVLLNSFPAVPSDAVLRSASVSATQITLDRNLRLPVTVQSNIGIEKQLPGKFIMAATATSIRSRNGLRTRLLDPAARRFQYESTGRFDQKQLSVTLSRRLSRASLYTTYNLASARDDTDGASSLPVDRSNPALDLGRASSDVRHSLYVGGWLKAFGFDISPTLVYRSNVPFNITVGRDLNGDTVLNDRPAFATDLTLPSVVATRFGTFDTDPIAGQQIIPRNYGTGSAFVSVNLNVSRTFTIGGEAGGGGRANLFGIEMPHRPANLTISLQAENIFNRANAYTPEGSLSSPLFGRSYGSAGAYGYGSYVPGNRVLRPYISFSF